MNEVRTFRRDDDVEAGDVEGMVLDLTRLDDADRTDVLGRVTVALASTLELREVLGRLARVGYEATDARHASVFVLEGRELFPTVAIGQRPERETWRAFKSMGPIRLDGHHWSTVMHGPPIAIGDAMASDLIPARWRQRFRPGAVVIVPLIAEGTPCGLLAVDWAAPREFDHDELSLLEAIATAAGVAVRNARLFEETKRRARLQEALTRATATLASPFDGEVIAERLVDAFSDLVDARLCAIGLLDTERGRITTVAARGPKALEGPIAVADIPDRVVQRAWRSWEQAKAPIEFAHEPWFHERLGGREAGAEWYLLSPLVAEGHTRGCVLLGFEASRRLDGEERAAVQALTDVASAAVERAVLIERRDRRLRRLDALYRVSAALTEGADAGTMVATLRDLLSGHGIEVRSLAFCDERVARRLHAEVLSPRERAVETDGADWATAANGDALVPLYLGRRLYGGLRVSPAALDAEDRSFLETLARGLAEVAHRDHQRARLEEAARERVLTAERDRMACDLHDTVGQVFVAMGLLARSHLEGPDGEDGSREVIDRLAQLADRGKWEIDHAARALAFVPATRRGLIRSLCALAEDVERDSGICITVSVSGTVERLDAIVERALYRVAHEAIANAWRHAQCRNVVVEVDFDDDIASAEAVRLRVADDGVGEPDRFTAGRGVEGMRRAVSECGGTLAIEPGHPRGTAITARVPRRPA